MVGLTRFLFLMKDSEKSGVLSNVYWGFSPFKKDVVFERVKKHFVLQAVLPGFSPILRKLGMDYSASSLFRRNI
jgi:hypothetical protein